MTDPAIGKWDESLFQQYRATPDGPRKRQILNRLLIINAPLAKTIVSQMCGMGDPKAGGKKTWHRKVGSYEGFDELEWDDAYQGGLIALGKALEQFDPMAGVKKAPGGYTFGSKPTVYATAEEAAARASFSSYLKTKCVHELQRLVFYGGDLVKVPRGAGVERVGVELQGEQEVLDRQARGAEDPELARVSGGGEWDLDEGGGRPWELEPDDIAVGNDVERRIIVPVYTNGLEAFLCNRVTLTRFGRVETWVAHNAYRLECRRIGRPELPRGLFVGELGRLAGVRETTMRVSSWEAPARALAGLRLCD